MGDRFRVALRAVAAAAAAFVDSTADRQRLLQTVVRTSAATIPDLCMVSMVQGDQLTIVAVHDDSAVVRAAYGAFMHQPRTLSAIAQRALVQTVFTPSLDYDVLDKLARADSAAVLRTIGARGMIVVPMRFRGELIGLLSVVRHRPEHPLLDDTDREIAELLAGYAALAIGTGRLASEREQLMSELATGRFLDAVIENIPDMVFVKDASELRFVRFNRAGEELVGVQRADLLGRSDRDLFPHDEAEFFIAKDRETLASGTLVEIAEEPIQTASGLRWLHTKKVPILDDAGTPRYLLGISEDITDKKRTLAELAAARDRAEAANADLEAFSYSVAHDLRAPLRAIDGFALALVEDHAAQLDPTAQHHLSRIRAAAQRMGAIIDDLLHLSRVTGAEQRSEPIDLAELVRASAAALARVEPSRTVEVIVPSSLPALGDPKLLALVFDNLLGNAWKFTSKVNAPVIEVGRELRAGEPVYFVRDNGAGFDPALAPRLFGVFQRLHSSSEFPGTGIGLATVRRVIERHGGRVWADGQIGQGATFYFTLAASRA